MSKKLIDQCRNMFGPLKPEYRKRLEAVLDNPTPKTWDDAYSIIITFDPLVTLWQAVCEVDTSFPRRAAADDNYNARWERIPDQFTLYRALNVALIHQIERSRKCK